MAFLVRVRGVEVVCETLEDVDVIVDRYGVEGTHQQEGFGLRRTDRPAGPSARDRAVLKTLVEAGTKGVSSKVLEDMLGRKAKALPPALSAWAARQQVTHDPSVFPFEAARPDGKRGWRLSEGAMTTAKMILGGEKES